VTVTSLYGWDFVNFQKGAGPNKELLQGQQEHDEQQLGLNNVVSSLILSSRK